MKYLKIKLEDNKSVLVDDSAKGKTGYCFNISLSKIDKLSRDYEIGTFEEMNTHKIIATINHSISLDVPMVIVEDEVEKLAKLNWGNVHRTGVLGFIDGYKASQQKGVYSEEDLVNLVAFICNKEDETDTTISESGEMPSLIVKRFIQPLKQEYIALEMERESSIGVTDTGRERKFYGEEIIKTIRIDGQLMAYVKQ
jgi:hypothetical protein